MGFETKEVWSDQLPGEKQLPIHNIAFKPDGSKLLACSGPRILVYNASNGELLQSLKGHKDNIYSVSYSWDGSKFASGGADKMTVIWSDEGKGILKYSHNSSVQVVAYNPRLDMLASCSNFDFGFWLPNEKGVAKHRIDAKVLAASWTHDGETIAIGLVSGVISLRDCSGIERTSISRSGPVWSLQWSPKSFGRQDVSDVLAVGCWDNTLSFYDLSGAQVGQDCNLDCCPCDVSFCGERGDYIVIAEGRNVSLCSREGIKLIDLLHGHDVWAVVMWRPGHQSLAVADHGGKLTIQSIEFDTVYARNHCRLAFRDRLTDIVVQNLINGQTVRIPCEDLVQHVSLRRGILAVLASNSVLLFEAPSNTNESLGMQYEYRDCLLNVTADCDCEEMLVLSSHLVLCQGKRLELFDLQGISIRHWLLDSSVCCLKSNGGLPGKEGILVGLENGQVLSIFIDNVFPVYVVTHSAPIRDLDINADRTKVAVVDDQERLSVYDMVTKEAVLAENAVTHLAFHSDVADLLCHSGGDGTTVTVRDIQASAFVRNPGGGVVDFRGSRAFCLQRQSASVETVDVDLSPIVTHFIDSGDFDQAYKVACAGVSDSMWAKLAHNAMDAVSLAVAKAAFLHVKDKIFMELITTTESLLDQHKGNQAADQELGATRKELDKERERCKKLAAERDKASALQKIKALFHAEKALLRRDYEAAAEICIKAGEVDKAVDMYCGLRKWDQAKTIAIAAKMDASLILQRQAQWSEERREWKVAADAYLSCSEYTKATKLIGDAKEEDWQEALMSIARKLPPNEVGALEMCASYFSEADLEGYAKEAYEKLGDFRGLLQLYIRNHRWDDVAALYQEHRNVFVEGDLLPYAEWLAVENRWEDAFRIFCEAGSLPRGQQLIRNMAKNSVFEGRLKDVAHFYCFLASESNKNAEGYNTYMAMSRLYYLYHHIDEYCNDRFTSLQPEALFQASRYLVHLLNPACIPEGLSLVKVLDTLAKQAVLLDAFQVARFAYKRMLKLDIEPSLRERIELDLSTSEQTPGQGNSSLQPVCFQCAEKNEIIHCSASVVLPSQDCCSNCGHPFIRCYANFDVLPLVQFVPSDGISDEDAMRMIRSQVDGESDDDECFNAALNTALTTQVTEANITVFADETTLMSLNREEVYALHQTVGQKRVLFYKNCLPDIGIAACVKCQHFFHEQDFEFLFLKESGCPFCRNRIAGDYGHL